MYKSSSRRALCGRANLILLVDVAVHRHVVRAYFLGWRVGTMAVVNFVAVDLRNNAVVDAVSKIATGRLLSS